MEMSFKICNINSEYLNFNVKLNSKGIIIYCIFIQL